MAARGGVVGAFPRVRTCISIRGADRPARAPPATLLHGALGIKKAALLPSIDRRAIARACLRGRRAPSWNRPRWLDDARVFRKQRTANLSLNKYNKLETRRATLPCTHCQKRSRLMPPPDATASMSVQ